jgi:hypothetical protein
MALKLLFTLAVVVLAWLVFKKVSLSARRGLPPESRAERIRRAAEAAVRARTGGAGPAAEPGRTVELVPCPSCGSYVAPGATCACGWKATD